jgi:hypothetical protein
MFLQEFGSISADNAISNTESHQNTVFIKQRDVILTNDMWTVIVNLDFSPYEQTIANLRDDSVYIQKFKTPLAPVHELNHIEYVLQKLEEEINAFREMLPRLDKRCAVLSAVGSVLKWAFSTATLLHVQELYEIVDKMHRTEGDIIHSVNRQMTYLKPLDSAVKFSTEAVETLSPKVKAIMLDSNKWKDETDIAIHWLNYSLYNHSNTFTYIRQIGLLFWSYEPW